MSKPTFPRCAAVGATALLVLLSASAAWAQNKGGGSTTPAGVITIDQAKAEAGGVTPGDAPGFPVTISQPGSYQLTSNLAVGEMQVHGILVTSDHVTLNLNGFLGYVSTPDGADTNIVLQYTGPGMPVALTQRPLLHLTVTSSATPAFQIVQSLSRNSALFVPNEVNTFPLLVTGGGGATPEPATLGVLAVGAAGLLARRRRT